MATYHVSMKSGGKGRASDHARYIIREGRYSVRDEDLIAHWSGNMPPWCAGNPNAFWRAADVNERKNGSTYRECEVALPKELNTAQQIALVQSAIQSICPNKPYQVAIHSPSASLGNGSQPHFHLMYSDRVDDGIERGPAQHFRRFNPVNPHLGGCRKDSGGKTPTQLRDALKTLRAEFANLINNALAQNGHQVTVDHRSNKERGLETQPGRHLGPYKARQLKSSAQRNSDSDLGSTDL